MSDEEELRRWLEYRVAEEEGKIFAEDEGEVLAEIHDLFDVEPEFRES